MTTASNEFPVYELVGQVMTDLGAHCEILILRFGEYEIHVSCFARILHNGKILLTTKDYQSWDEKDHKQNDMYLNIAKYGETLIGQKVRSVEVSPINDLFIVLDNDTRNTDHKIHGTRRLRKRVFPTAVAFFLTGKRYLFFDAVIQTDGAVAVSLRIFIGKKENRRAGACSRLFFLHLHRLMV